MCGIVGLFAKTKAMEPELGAHLAGMLAVMTERGPDSAGFAIYAEARPGCVKLTLRGGPETDWMAVRTAAGEDCEASQRGTHLVLSVPQAMEAALLARLAADAPEVAVVGTGLRMELFKEIGAPAAVAERFGLSGMTGSHGVGHTRMATESAVTTDGAHPYSTGPDQCLVHNGSLSNHNAVRRALARDGYRCVTENDTEVAALYLSRRLRQGLGLEAALRGALVDLDGFYTFVMGTATGFAVLRDPIACKPAVMAETEAWVAFGSEYRALADLPGIGQARIWEPEPGIVYAWERPH
jgi:glutamate synthase domain-containing protein 1